MNMKNVVTIKDCRAADVDDLIRVLSHAILTLSSIGASNLQRKLVGSAPLLIKDWLRANDFDVGSLRLLIELLEDRVQLKP